MTLSGPMRPSPHIPSVKSMQESRQNDRRKWLGDHFFLVGSVVIALYAAALELFHDGAGLGWMDFAFENGWGAAVAAVVLVGWAAWGWTARKKRKVSANIALISGTLLLLFLGILFVEWRTGTTFLMLGGAYLALAADYGMAVASRTTQTFPGAR